MLGEGRSSYTQGDPPMGRGPPAMGETLREMVGEGRKGMEGNGASAFPVHLGTRKPVGFLGLILCPRSLPPAAQSPSPAPTPPPRAPLLPSEIPSETPSNTLGLNPTHTPSSGPHLQTPELYTPDALLSTCCLSPSAQVLSRGSTPMLDVPQPRPRPTFKRHPPTHPGPAPP